MSENSKTLETTKKLQVHIHNLVNFSEENRVLFEQLMLVCADVVSSEDFKERVLNYSWTSSYKKWFKRYYTTHDTFAWNKGMANEQVYNLFMTGADKFNPEKDGDLDLYLTLYYSRNNVIGYTYPNTFWTWANTKYFLNNLKTSRGRSYIIGNIVHEYMHNVGFDHAYRSTYDRPYTVPYAFGNIAGQVALKYL